MPGVKTNEVEGTRAVLRHAQVSAYKVREVLDLVRGQHVSVALDTLRLSERDAALLIEKLLRSAIANAMHNDGLDPEELYVSACFADEGPTLKRFRPRARGRAGRIRKRRSHITVIVSRLPEAELARFRERQVAAQAAQRARRVAGGRRGQEAQGQREESNTTEAPEASAATAATDVTEAAATEELAEAPVETQEEAAAEVAEESAEVAESHEGAEASTEAAEERTEADDQAGDEPSSEKKEEGQ